MDETRPTRLVCVGTLSMWFAIRDVVVVHGMPRVAIVAGVGVRHVIGRGYGGAIENAKDGLVWYESNDEIRWHTFRNESAVTLFEVDRTRSSAK